MNSLLSKMQVRDRTQAATVALKRGQNDFNPADADANGFFTDTNIVNWSQDVVQPFPSLMRLDRQLRCRRRSVSPALLRHEGEASVRLGVEANRSSGGGKLPGRRTRVPRFVHKTVAKPAGSCLNRVMASLPLPIFRAVLLVGGLLCCTELLWAQPASKSGQKVTLVGDETVAAPVQHGIGKLKLALGQKGVLVVEATSLRMATNRAVVVAGLTAGQGEAARLSADLRLTPYTESESLLVRKFNREGKTMVLLAGADACQIATLI